MIKDSFIAFKPQDNFPLSFYIFFKIHILFLHLGMKEDELGMNSPLMWLQGDNGDRSLQSLNFQGIGVAPWMQPRIDASMLGMQNHMYQAMAAAALQEMRASDPSKQTLPSVLQFQNTPGMPPGLVQPQMLQQSQPQSQSHLLQQQLQHQNAFNNQNQQQPPLSQQQQQQQVSNAVSALSQFASNSQAHSPSLQAISSMCQQQSFSDSNGNPVTNGIVSPLHSLMGSFTQEEASHLLNLPRNSDALLSSSGWPPKRIAVDHLLSSAASQCILPQVEQLGPHRTNTSRNAISLPPFPGRECSIDQEGSNDHQNHLLFGVNIDSSSLLMHNGMSGIRGVGSDGDSANVHFASSNNYLSNSGTTGTDFSTNPVLTPSSCIDESGFLQSPENLGQENQPTGTFVKVTSLTCLSLFSYVCQIFSTLFLIYSLPFSLSFPRFPHPRTKKQNKTKGTYNVHIRTILAKLVFLSLVL